MLGGGMLRLRQIAWRLKQSIKTRQRIDGKVRLHLGCGRDYWPGWVNVEISPSAMCDLRLDFTLIRERYPDNSIAEIAMIHSLSYLRLWQARELLADLYHLLKPGGRLVIELPDLVKCARKALESEDNPVEYMEAVRGLYAFGIDQIERREMFIPYAFGWAGSHLKRELEQIGFSQVLLCEPQTHGPRPWRDTRIEATK
jgi:SAM-dependent methyltransferase